MVEHPGTHRDEASIRLLLYSSSSNHQTLGFLLLLLLLLLLQIKTCDTILSGMEQMLAKFQSELGKVRRACSGVHGPIACA